jgi:hypothetical protein
LKPVNRRAINLLHQSAPQTSFLKQGDDFPLVIRPAMSDIKLMEWININIDFVQTNLLKYGALLLRDYSVNSASEFYQVSSILIPELKIYRIGYTDHKAPDSQIHSTVSIPSSKRLLWHNEDSFNHYRWPMRVMFYCHKPADQGGETPLVDCRKLSRLIDPKINQRFLDKGIMFVKNYWPKFGMSYDRDFGTSDKNLVMEYCRRYDMDFEWGDDDHLRTRCVRRVIDSHPRTGEKIWFNQAQLWHSYCVDAEILSLWSSIFKEDDYPYNCYYGDGARIEDSIMNEICEAAKMSEVRFPWQRGDILIIENMLIAHGRSSFVGVREHFKTEGDYMTWEDVQ